MDFRRFFKIFPAISLQTLFVTNKKITRRPLSTGIFSATLLLQKKYGEEEDRTHDLLAGKHEKLQAPAPGSNPRPTGWESNT